MEHDFSAGDRELSPVALNFELDPSVRVTMKQRARGVGSSSEVI